MDASRNRVTVQEAARTLGVTEQAVRKRIKRGTLEAETVNRRVYVYLDAGETSYEPSYEPSATDPKDELIAELRDRVRSLEEANRENRRLLLLAMQERQIEAPGDHDRDPDLGHEEEPPESTEGSRRSWWRRLLGR